MCSYAAPPEEEEPPALPFPKGVLLDKSGRPRWLPELLLGVPLAASEDEVKKAKRRLQLRYHPDKRSGNVETSRLINAAADILLLHRADYEEWLWSGGVALELVRAAVTEPSPLFTPSAGQGRATLTSLIDGCVDKEAQMAQQQQQHREAIKTYRKAISRAEKRAPRAEEAAEAGRRQLGEVCHQLVTEQSANEALRAELGAVKEQLKKQTEVALAGQLAELWATKYAAGLRSARAQATEEIATARAAAAAVVNNARAEAAAEVAGAHTATAEELAAVRAAAAAEVTNARAEAAAEIAAARAEAAAEVAATAEELATARAAAAATRAEAAAEEAAAKRSALIHQCLVAVSERRVNSAIRRKALYLLERMSK